MPTALPKASPARIQCVALHPPRWNKDRGCIEVTGLTNLGREVRVSYPVGFLRFFLSAIFAAPKRERF